MSTIAGSSLAASCSLGHSGHGGACPAVPASARPPSVLEPFGLSPAYCTTHSGVAVRRLGSRGGFSSVSAGRHWGGCHSPVRGPRTEHLLGLGTMAVTCSRQSSEQPVGVVPIYGLGSSCCQTRPSRPRPGDPFPYAASASGGGGVCQVRAGQLGTRGERLCLRSTKPGRGRTGRRR